MARTAAKRRSRRRDAEEEGSGLLAAASVEAVGVGLIGLALLSLLALATYVPSDPVFSLAPAQNGAGVVGASLAGVLYGGLGMAAFVVVAALAFLGGRLILGHGVPGPLSRFWVGSLLLIPSVATLPPLLARTWPTTFGDVVAGRLGSALAESEQLLLSAAGAVLVNAFLLTIGGLSVTGLSTATTLNALGRAGGAVLRVIAALAHWFGVQVRRAVEACAAAMTEISGQVRGAFETLALWREQRAVRRARAAEREDVGPELIEDEPGFEEVLEAEVPAVPPPAPRPGRRAAKGEEPDIVDHGEEREKKRKPEQETFRFHEGGPAGPFRLPDVSLFQAPPKDARTYDRDSLLMNSRILEKKLSDFGVMGRVVRVHPGPVITMYEFEPAPGIKVNRIVGLTDDLAMALRAISIRIIAPLPGKSVVGIEVPNPERETVYLRTCLEAESFRKHKSKLSVAMGKDIFGNSVAADLARMPHLLVAGSTGTGKSVFLNSFLCSLLCKARPDELKLLLVDPKLLELSIYEGIPHLIADVVTHPKRASAALQGIVRKMEERYQMMSAVQVRNIDQFNERARKALEAGEETFQLKPKPGEEEGEEVAWEQLPFIVVVIDELADLMVLVAKDVEESLQRLAQMARAAGIHLVLATQRPSVDVLTGVIKANFPARVSFQVSSGTDSRTILDQKGAENLLGMGDMLFLPPGTAVLQRLHGPFVSETEVTELVSYLRDQGKPEFDEQLIQAANEGVSDGSERDEEVDEFFDQAVAIVAETRNASISYVQRRLKIGYNRAARIIEQMENDGMIGPQIGTRPREVFLHNPEEDE